MEVFMIILNKKQLVLMILVVLLLIIILLKLTKTKIMLASTIPAKFKTIVLDAGHGLPDERCIKQKWSNRG